MTAPLIYESEDGVIKRDLSTEEVFSTGLLWAINRTLFHPRGYALGVNTKTGEICLWGNGDEPWVYAESLDENAKFNAFNELLESVTKHG